MWTQVMGKKIWLVQIDFENTAFCINKYAFFQFLPIEMVLVFHAPESKQTILQLCMHQSSSYLAQAWATRNSWWVPSSSQI